MLLVPPLLLSVSREKYPRWWFDFNLAYLRLHNRAITYLLPLRDEYPSSDEDQAVHLRWHNRVMGYASCWRPTRTRPSGWQRDGPAGVARAQEAERWPSRPAELDVADDQRHPGGAARQPLQVCSHGD